MFSVIELLSDASDKVSGYSSLDWRKINGANKSFHVP